MQSQSRENYETKVQILKCILRSVLYCGRQHIAFITKNEGKFDGKENTVNFVVFLKGFGEHDKILQTYLNSLAIKNVIYLCPDIQNKLINIIGKDLILNDIISEIKDSKFFSIMAVEGTSLEEVCTSCSRFIERDNNINK